MTPRVRRWTVIGLVAVALAGTVVAVRLRSGIGITEVWLIDGDRETELYGEPGGAPLDGYIYMPCTDSSGGPVRFVARRRSPLDVTPALPIPTDGGPIHLMEETGTVVEAGGKRWRFFRVAADGLTPDEVLRGVTSK